MTFLIITFLLLLFFYLLFIFRVTQGIKFVLKNKKNTFSEYLPTVSLIIPFRNEEACILNSLNSLLEIDYPNENIEIIYVDDNSVDNSYDKLAKVIETDDIKCKKNIRLLKSNFGNLDTGQKKGAILTGIENSTGELIITTDADCFFNKNWIKTIVSEFDENVGLVSGPVFYSGGNSLFVKLQQMEFAGLILVGAGLIGINKPFLCNGANNSYRRKAFESVGGFEDNMHFSSGDDEFLMQKIAEKREYKVRFCFNEAAVVYTYANQSVKSFIMQRRRMASKGLFYKNKFNVVALIIIYFFYLSLPIMLTLGILVNPFFLVFFFCVLLLKACFEFGILKYSKHLFKTNIDISLFTLAQFFHIPYIIIIPLLGVLGNYTWKDRKLKR